MTQRLIEGVVADDDPTADVIAALENQVDRLERELDRSRVETQRAKEDAVRAMGMLRKQLGPLYRALQAVFGELDAAGVNDGPLSGAVPSASSGSQAGQDARVVAIWNQWKSRLGGQCAKIIDVLLLQPDMNSTQLAIAIGTRRENIPNLIFKLNKAGLINKNGGRFSLKAL